MSVILRYMTDWLKKYDDIHNKAITIFREKNADYGDAFAEYGPVGVLVRMGDKIKRLQTITNNGITMVQDERMQDTLLDLHNYAAMAIMLLDEKKKILHRRINEIKHAGPINEIVNPLATRLRKPTFSERRRNSWATGYLKKEDKMGEWARLSRSSESRK